MQLHVGLLVIDIIREKMSFNAHSTLNSPLRKVIYLHISYI